MKKIQTALVITSFRSKVDGSLGITASTPELSPVEKVAFMELQNQNLEALFTPTEEPKVAEIKVDKDLKGKSQSARLRGVLFVKWKQSGEKEEWETFYKKMMEKILDQIKDTLE